MKLFKSPKLLHIVANVIAIAGLAQSAGALTLRFQDLRYEDASILSTFLIEDNGVNDSDQSIGAIRYQGLYRGYEVSAQASVLTGDRFGVSQAGHVTALGPEGTDKDGVLQISATVTDFILSPPQIPQGAQIFVSAGQDARFEYWGENMCFRGQADAQNRPFGVGVFGGPAEFSSACAGDSFPPGTGFLNLSGFADLRAGEPFSVTSDVQIVRATNNEFPGSRPPLGQTYAVSSYVIPVPAALPLMATGLVLIGFLGRRGRRSR